MGFNCRCRIIVDKELASRLMQAEAFAVAVWKLLKQKMPPGWTVEIGGYREQ